MQLHLSFVAATGNSRLIRIYKTLATESRMCILDLEAAGDRQGFLTAIKRHMQKAVEDLTATQQDKQGSS